MDQLHAPNDNAWKQKCAWYGHTAQHWQATAPFTQLNSVTYIVSYS